MKQTSCIAAARLRNPSQGTAGSRQANLVVPTGFGSTAVDRGERVVERIDYE